MHFVAYSNEKATPEAGHFVGLLCLGRVFRMLFWGIITAHLSKLINYLFIFVLNNIFN